MLTVRRARREDAQAVWQMNREFNGETGVTLGQIAEGLAQNGCEIVLIVQEGGETLGFACARACASVCYPDKAGELTELYVREGARRRGAGRALVEAAVEELRRAGAGEITVLTGGSNFPAQALYEACGFRPSGEWHFALEGGAPPAAGENGRSEIILI